MDSSTSSLFIPMILMIVIWYFLLIRPQQKRAKQHRDMVEALKKGDEVITQGGIYGKVAAADDHVATVEISKGVNIRVVKSTIQSVTAK